MLAFFCEQNMNSLRKRQIDHIENELTDNLIKSA